MFQNCNKKLYLPITAGMPIGEIFEHVKVHVFVVLFLFLNFFKKYFCFKSPVIDLNIKRSSKFSIYKQIS